METSPALDLLGLYLNEIGTVPLLTPEQEIELSETIHAGRQAYDQFGQLEASGETDEPTLDALYAVAEAGRVARTQFIAANLRLVVSIARKYRGTMEQMDLIQEGNLGLFRAVDHFDHTKGFKFSTYATWSIQRAIKQSINDKVLPIRVPSHTLDDAYRLRRSGNDLRSTLGRDPTTDELMQAVGMPLEKVRHLQAIPRVAISLDKPLIDDSDRTVEDLISNDEEGEESFSSVLEKMTSQELREVLLASVDGSERNLAIMVKRFGLDSGEATTVEELGKEFQLSKQRVSQIEAKVLKRMRINLGMFTPPENRSTHQKGLLEIFGQNPERPLGGPILQPENN